MSEDSKSRICDVIKGKWELIEKVNELMIQFNKDYQCEIVGMECGEENSLDGYEQTIEFNIKTGI